MWINVGRHLRWGCLLQTQSVIDTTWHLQLDNQEENLQNPYRPPTSTLRGRIGHSRDWSPEAINSAKKYIRCLFLGLGSALCTVLLAWLVLDIFLNGWEEISLPNIPTQWLVLLTFPLAFIGNSQCSKICVKYLSRRKTVQEFFKSCEREMGRWYNGPLVLTIVVGSLAIPFLLCVHWISNLLDFRSTISTIRLQALLAIPPVLPIVYFVLRYTLQKAGRYLESLKQ